MSTVTRAEIYEWKFVLKLLLVLVKFEILKDLIDNLNGIKEILLAAIYISSTRSTRVICIRTRQNNGFVSRLGMKKPHEKDSFGALNV